MFQIIFDSYHPGFDAATSKTLIELLITCNQQIMIFVFIILREQESLAVWNLEIRQTQDFLIMQWN